MQQVDTLLIAQRKEAPRWHRQYKNEDPRCVHYHRMLKRIGLSEKHARVRCISHYNEPSQGN